MVRWAEKPSLREASCCRVEVVKGGGGRAPGRLLLDRRDLEAGRPRPRPWRRRRAASSARSNLVEPLALVLDQPGQERIAAGGDVGLDGPVFLGPEGLDLDLAVDDQAQRHRLHPAGRARARQLAPQHRREGEADQIVQRAAGEVGLDQLHVDVARMLHRLGDRRAGDGVEHHPLDLGALDRLAAVQHLQHVPADRLALAVGVGGEDQPVGALERRRRCRRGAWRPCRRPPRSWRSRRRAAPSRPWTAGRARGRSEARPCSPEPR